MLAVPNHGDAVAEFKEFLQLVGDEENGHALGLQVPDRLHQLCDLLLAQGGGGFIHDDELGVQGDGLGDLHHLLLAHAQLAALHMNVNLRVAQGLQRLLGLPVHPGIVQQDALFNGAPHKHIVRHRELLDNVQLLIDAGNARLP